MFQATVTRRHSPRTQSSPRSRNCRKPSTDLIMPNTGSGTCLRSTQSFLPSWVLSRCATASTGVGFSGAVGAAAKPTMPDDAARLACPHRDCVAGRQPAWPCRRLSIWHRRRARPLLASPPQRSAGAHRRSQLCQFCFAGSLAAGGLLAGCGRRNVAPDGLGFFSAFGFLGSRFPRLRPLANVVLPVV